MQNACLHPYSSKRSEIGRAKKWYQHEKLISLGLDTEETREPQTLPRVRGRIR